MNMRIGVAVIAALVALVVAWYAWQQGRAKPALPPPAPLAAAPAAQAQPPVSPPASAQPAIRYSLGIMPSPSMLPELGRSDAPFLKSLGDWLGHRILALLFSDEAIRRIAKTVDNLPRKKLPPDAMPLKPVPGAFFTTGKGDALAIGRRNASRYTTYAGIMRAVDAGKLVGIYVDFYPLFQRAYEDLTNNNAYFNDRLVEAIDDMLAAPDPAGPVRLVRSDGFFVFADPELEARSAGQKILIRTGAANSTAIKAKLREIRQEITHRAGAVATGDANGPGESALKR